MYTAWGGARNTTEACTSCRQQGMWAVKLRFNKILQFLTVGAGCSDIQGSAWRLTTLPQFVGPCRRRVWSTSTPLCRMEPFTDSAFKLSIIGGWAFPVAAAQFWNSLPDNVTSANSLSTFRQQLKHTLFQQSFPDIIMWHFLTVTATVA